jgi:hypothetical protein
MELACKVTACLPDSDEQPWGLTALPLQDRISASIQYVNARGMVFMYNTHMADYRKSRHRPDWDESRQVFGTLLVAG